MAGGVGNMAAPLLTLHLRRIFRLPRGRHRASRAGSKTKAGRNIRPFHAKMGVD
jgi:hypothetical protein